MNLYESIFSVCDASSLSIVVSYMKKKNIPVCSAVIFFIKKNGEFQHAAISGIYYGNDLYYYGHTSARNGDGGKYGTLLSTKFDSNPYIYICILKHLKRC